MSLKLSYGKSQSHQEQITEKRWGGHDDATNNKWMARNYVYFHSSLTGPTERFPETTFLKDFSIFGSNFNELLCYRCVNKDSNLSRNWKRQDVNGIKKTLS